MLDTVLATLGPFAREFTRHGKSVYLVGGAVRNLLLGRAVQDYDFATDALPGEVQALFSRVIPTGIDHGTVTVLFRGQAYEVTTFRVDGEYRDGRRPDAVGFTRSLEEDLARRDFTINALALDLASGELHDPHNGRADLEQGVLRAIGRPRDRFTEDALRVLRLHRFRSQLGFRIEAETGAAAYELRERLTLLSRERVREELVKTLAGPHCAPVWSELQRQGILDLVLPGLPLRPVSDINLDRLTTLPPLLRWAYWLALAGPADLEVWSTGLKALTFSRADAQAVVRAVEGLGLWQGRPFEAKAVVEHWGERGRAREGADLARALGQAGYLAGGEGLAVELRRLADSPEPVFLRDLAVGGREVEAAGVPRGAAVGAALRALLRQVWQEPGLNRPELLLARLERL